MNRDLTFSDSIFGNSRQVNTLREKNTNGTLLGFTTIISPSQEKQTVHYEQVVSTINAHKTASQVKLIGKLNPIIRGWANYYSCVVSKDTYYHQDYLMYQKLRAWAKRRHPNKSGKWVSNKYWHTFGGDNWVFATRQENNPLRLFKHGDTPRIRHEKIKGDVSPYDGNLIYWSKRMGTHPEMPTRVATLLKKQKGKCAYCELYFREEDVLEVDHVTPKSKGGKDKYQNFQLLHRHCHDVKTTEDGSIGGTHDKRQFIEEPDDAKVSRPVLKTSDFREEIA
jgi:RNA-directed DNA polymerase